METLPAKTTFSFVNYDNHRVPQDPKSRTLIRRHAMRDVAITRKQKGNYRGNAIQYPPESVFRGQDNHSPYTGTITISSGTTCKRRSTKCSKSKNTTKKENSQQLVHIHTILPEDFEPELSIGFPVLELIAPLTSLHLGIATISCFSSEPGMTGDVLSAKPLSHLQSRGLLSYLPSRYGKVSALTSIVDCLVARLNQITRSSRPVSPGSLIEENGVVFYHYAKALKEIQRAIDDDELRMSQETLYATELLGIFELLSPHPDMNSWICHAGGAARLIQLHGPERFKSDFELALFMAHIGPIVTEAFLNNKNCFLTEEPWQKVLYAAICNDPSIPRAQSRLIHELWSCLIFGPNIFKMVTSLVMAPVEPPPCVIERAIKRVLLDLEHLNVWAGWLELHQSAIEAGEAEVNDLLVANNSSDWGSTRIYMPWQVLQGTFTMCSIMKRRLLTCLAPSRYLYREEECQSLASMVMELNSDPIPPKRHDLPGGLFMAQTIWLAKAVTNTKDIWYDKGMEEDKTGLQERSQGSMIEKWKFSTWCKELGRRVT